MEFSSLLPAIPADFPPLRDWATFYGEQLLVDLGQFSLIAGAFYLIFYIALPGAFAHRKVQAAWPSPGDVRREVLLSIQSVAIFAAFGVLIIYLYQVGWTRLYLGIEPYGWTYLVCSIPLVLLLQDTWFYWAHRFLHWRPVYRRIHCVHHESHNPTPWAAFSFHPLEAVLNALIFPLVIVLLPINLWVEWIWFFYMFLVSVYLHLGYEMMPKSVARHWLYRWPTSAMHHSMHHSHFNCNYSLYFTVWDRLMATKHPDYEKQFEEVTTAAKAPKGFASPQRRARAKTKRQGKVGTRP